MLRELPITFQSDFTDFKQFFDADNHSRFSVTRAVGPFHKAITVAGLIARLLNIIALFLGLASFPRSLAQQYQIFEQSI